MDIRNLERKKVIEYPSQVTERPLVSVIVMAYNHESYIRKCLDSVIDQEVDFPYEIILGEDESTDGTRQICLEYAARHPDKVRLFLHHRENNMVIDGRPTGRFNFLYSIVATRGKYVAMCDGDDYWTNRGKLKRQVEILESNGEASFCHHAFHVLQEGGLEVVKNRNELNRRKPLLHFEDILDFPYPKILTVMFRREVLDLNNLLFYLADNRVGDIPFWHLLLLKGSGYFEDIDMGCYRSNPGGVTNGLKEDAAILDSKIQILEKLLKAHAYPNESLLHEYLAKHYVTRHAHTEETKDLFSALKHKLKSGYRMGARRIKNRATIQGILYNLMSRTVMRN